MDSAAGRPGLTGLLVPIPNHAKVAWLSFVSVANDLCWPCKPGAACPGGKRHADAQACIHTVMQSYGRAVIPAIQSYSLQSYIHALKQSYQSYSHASIHSYCHTCMHAYIHTQTYTHTHTKQQANTYKHTNKQTYMHACMLALFGRAASDLKRTFEAF